MEYPCGTQKYKNESRRNYFRDFGGPGKVVFFFFFLSFRENKGAGIQGDRVRLDEYSIF
jgi:hypothetical protein